MKYFIQTLGCQMNYSDTERLARVLENLGYKKSEIPEESDLYFFNTCSVKQKGEDRVLGMLKNLKKWKKKNPNFFIGITGCMVRHSSSLNSEKKDKLLKYGFDLALKIEDLGMLRNLMLEASPNLKLNENIGNLGNYFDIFPKYENQFQAFVPIMTGCNNFCTYCVVPYARGREKSRTREEILKEVNDLVKNGCKEITLLGQNVNSYSFDFVKLLEEVNKIDGLKRIRFTSSHPKDMSDELIKAIGSLNKMCNHVHLPIQSGDNKVLKRMNRNYTIEHYLELIRKLRESIPKVTISTDLIVGFCEETEEEFLNTYNLFKKIEWDMIYFSKYSPRPETVSAKTMEDNVPREEKSKRWHKINELLKIVAFEKNKAYIGREEDILIEKIKDNKARGKTRSFKEVSIEINEDKNVKIGDIVKVKIEDAQKWMLFGKLI